MGCYCKQNSSLSSSCLHLLSAPYWASALGKVLTVECFLYLKESFPAEIVTSFVLSDDFKRTAFALPFGILSCVMKDFSDSI